MENKVRKVFKKRGLQLWLVCIVCIVGTVFSLYGFQKVKKCVKPLPMKRVESYEYFRYTILPKPVVNRELILRIEFKLLIDTEDSALILLFPEDFQMEFPDEIGVVEDLRGGYFRLHLGDLVKGQRYEYDIKLNIKRKGYWGTVCELESPTLRRHLLPNGDVIVRYSLISATRFIMATEKGGRIEEWDFDSVWDKIRHYLVKPFKNIGVKP